MVSIVFSWPLPLHLGTALTGEPGGDTGVYVWNQWLFQHEALVAGSNPFRTERVLSLIDRVDLSQHNYTVFLDLLALPLIPLVGVVAGFNLVLLVLMPLSAVAVYALAREVTAASRLEAWLAGLAFAWSPALVGRSTGQFSLVAAAPLAAFLLFLIRADRSRRMRDAALAGLCMAWAGLSDPYFAIYCLLIAVGYIVSRALQVTRSPHPGAPSLRWALNLLIVAVAGLVLGLIVGGGGRFEVLGVPVSVQGLYTPVFVLTLLVLARLLVEFRPQVTAASLVPSRPLLRALLVAAIACGGPLAPVLYGLTQQLMTGRFVSPPILWRSSPRGVDLLGLFSFNPNHPLARMVNDRQAADGAVFVEYTAAFSLVALAVVALSVWRAGYRPRAGWWWLTAGFAALSLGPFVYVAGVNTFVPGPWALLRYVPLIGTARTPTRFSIVAALGLAILLAGALAALSRRYPAQRRLIVATAAALLVFELWPAPRPLYAATIPSLFEIIARDPRPIRVLHLPFGVRDGTFSAGNFSARALFYQTAHGKPLIGGYLSRISRQAVADVRAQPTLDALVTLSEGATLSADHAAWVAARGERFVTRSRLGYVVIDHRLAPPALTDFAIGAWRLEEVAREGELALYRPTIATR